MTAQFPTIALLCRLAAEGVAILPISSDLLEILALSDRVLTLRAIIVGAATFEAFVRRVR